jgi:hypothetical protein
VGTAERLIESSSPRGGYVLARAADDTARFDRAVAGVLALLDRARV